MMGTGTFAEPTFERLLAGPDDVVGLVTQPDRDPGKVRGTTRQTGRGMKAIAEEAGLRVIQPDSVNTPEAIEELRTFGAELFVVAAYGQILSPEVLAVPKEGAINVHASLLPKYRGAAPVAWAIYHGESETGVTIIRITPSLDAGEMLEKVIVTIGPKETAGELEARIAPLGAEAAMSVIAKMREGPVSGDTQEADEVTRAPKLRKHHGAIDWSRSAELIARQIRAMQPWPSAYTHWHRAGSSKPPIRLQITRGAAVTGAGDPGSISVDGTDLGVACGEGTLLVTELQPAGKKKMTAEEFLRGQRPQPGDRFGPEATS